jgi:hypothetical protein
MAYVNAGDEGDLAVDRKGLAMTSAEPAHGTVDARRIESSDLDARRGQDSPAAPGGTQSTKRARIL